MTNNPNPGSKKVTATTTGSQCSLGLLQSAPEGAVQTQQHSATETEVAAASSATSGLLTKQHLEKRSQGRPAAVGCTAASHKERLQYWIEAAEAHRKRAQSVLQQMPQRATDDSDDLEAAAGNQLSSDTVGNHVCSACHPTVQDTYDPPPGTPMTEASAAEATGVRTVHGPAEMSGYNSLAQTPEKENVEQQQRRYNSNSPSGWSPSESREYSRQASANSNITPPLTQHQRGTHTASQDSIELHALGGDSPSKPPLSKPRAVSASTPTAAVAAELSVPKMRSVASGLSLSWSFVQSPDRQSAHSFKQVLGGSKTQGAVTATSSATGTDSTTAPSPAAHALGPTTGARTYTTSSFQSLPRSVRHEHHQMTTPRSIESSCPPTPRDDLWTMGHPHPHSHSHSHQHTNVPPSAAQSPTKSSDANSSWFFVSREGYDISSPTAGEHAFVDRDGSLVLENAPPGATAFPNQTSLISPFREPYFSRALQLGTNNAGTGHGGAAGRGRKAWLHVHRRQPWLSYLEEATNVVCDSAPLQILTVPLLKALTIAAHEGSISGRRFVGNRNSSLTDVDDQQRLLVESPTGATDLRIPCAAAFALFAHLGTKLVVNEGTDTRDDSAGPIAAGTPLTNGGAAAAASTAMFHQQAATGSGSQHTTGASTTPTARTRNWLEAVYKMERRLSRQYHFFVN